MPYAVVYADGEILGAHGSDPLVAMSHAENYILRTAGIDALRGSAPLLRCIVISDAEYKRLHPGEYGYTGPREDQ